VDPADRSGMDRWPWLFLLAATGVAVWRAVRRRDRARQLMLLCHRAGIEFSPIDPFPDTLWLPFRWLGEGRWTRAEHVVWNRADGHDARAFDLLVEEARSEESTPATVRRYSCAVAALPFGCPRLEIVPRDVLGQVADALVADEVQLELEAFNRRFRVRSSDRRLAVAFCDQRMMRSLMALPPGVTVAVHEDRILARAAELPPAEVLLLLEAVRAVARAVPPVVSDLYPPRPMKGRHEDRWLQGRWSPEPIGDDVADAAEVADGDLVRSSEPTDHP
jgi:hypothetical protein